MTPEQKREITSFRNNEVLSVRIFTHKGIRVTEIIFMETNGNGTTGRLRLAWARTPFNKMVVHGGTKNPIIHESYDNKKGEEQRAREDVRGMFDRLCDKLDRNGSASNEEQQSGS